MSTKFSLQAAGTCQISILSELILSKHRGKKINSTNVLDSGLPVTSSHT